MSVLAGGLAEGLIRRMAQVILSEGSGIGADATNRLVLDQVLIGRVMTQATSIERMIGAYIAEFYTRCPAADYREVYLAFMYDVMDSRGVALDTKIEILSKIYQRMLGKDHKLNKTLFKKWLKIRNILAHGVYITDKGILYGGEFSDINKLAASHANLQVSIHAELERLSDLRGPYFNHFPTKEWENQK